MKPNSIPCAVYTRKSSEEGLEQDFNSLDAQREAGLAFILSQRSLGWQALRDEYDDGGFSGGTTERPALQRLLADIEAGKVKVVVVYKVDRLTRSLSDFAKMVELFDKQGVSFVSVTQQFNTTTSMGRLTLNVLLSFAQFEREVTGERIRDKIAASKKKGMWMGGFCPMGYRPHERTLQIDEPQAERVRELFRLYLELGNVRLLQQETERRGWRTPARITQRKDARGEQAFSRGHLYKILSNPVYRGLIAHKGQLYPGNHPAIVDEATWDAVQRKLQDNRQGEHHRRTMGSQHLLAGLVFDTEGNRLTAEHSTKGSRRYRYYVQREQDKPMRIPAPQLEQAVRDALADYLEDHKRVLADAPRTDSTQVLQAATQLREHLKSDAAAIRESLDQVVVGNGELSIQLQPNLVAGCERPEPIHVPIEIKRAGLAVRLVIPSHRAQTRQPDARLIRLLAKAHEWGMSLISGKVRAIQEISDAEKVSGSYVTRVVQLSFLAPDVVERLLRGEHAEDLTVQKLGTIGNLPLDWQEQRLALNLVSAARGR